MQGKKQQKNYSRPLTFPHCQILCSRACSAFPTGHFPSVFSHLVLSLRCCFWHVGICLCTCHSFSSCLTFSVIRLPLKHNFSTKYPSMKEHDTLLSVLEAIIWLHFFKASHSISGLLSWHLPLEHSITSTCSGTAPNPHLQVAFVFAFHYARNALPSSIPSSERGLLLLLFVSYLSAIPLSSCYRSPFYQALGKLISDSCPELTIALFS